MTHPTTRTASHALIDVSPNVGHNDLIALIGDHIGVIRKNGAISSDCAKTVVALLTKVMDEIDQDLVNQQAEQAWSDKQSRDAAFGPSPADRFLAESIAAIRNKPLEMT